MVAAAVASQLWMLACLWLLHIVCSVGCGRSLDLQRCVMGTVPILDSSNCSTWSCKPVTVPGRREPCCMPHVARDEAALLLNNTSIMFIGSGARYGAFSVLSLLSQRPFASYSLREQTAQTVSADAWSVHVASSDVYVVGDLLADLASAQRRSAAFGSLPKSFRRVFVVSFGAHEFKHSWKTPETIESFNMNKMSQFVDDVMEAIALMKTHNIVDPLHDVIVLQLPRPVGYPGTQPNLVNALGGTHDPVNDQLAAAGMSLWHAAQSTHPDVAVVDLGWARSPDGIGRHTCAPFDNTGSRFTSEITREQVLAQVLYAIKVFRCTYHMSDFTFVRQQENGNPMTQCRR
jgi:hypothetical protein